MNTRQKVGALLAGTALVIGGALTAAPANAAAPAADTSISVGAIGKVAPKLSRKCTPYISNCVYLCAGQYGPWVQAPWYGGWVRAYNNGRECAFFATYP